MICAFGRLGRWFGAEHFEVRPDMLTFAKAVTSGCVPLGGVVVGEAVRRPLEADGAWMLRHGHTSSGHATACAVALANLDVLKGLGSAGTGRDHRRPAVRRGPGPGRGRAAGRGAQRRRRGPIRLTSDHESFAVRDRLMDAGVITRAVNPETLSWCPPLVITDDQVDRIVDAVAPALA